MKVKRLKDQQTMEVNAGFGARLIEQGKAVLPEKQNQPETAEKKRSKKAVSEDGAD